MTGKTMRKTFVAVTECLIALFAAGFLAYCPTPGHASSPTPPINREIDDRRLDVGFQLEEDLLNLAKQIIAHNKPTLEAKLTEKEREIDVYGDDDKLVEVSNVIWVRVWAKGKTIVIAGAGSDKKFFPFYVVTGDPNYVFHNNIRAGADIKIIEDLIGAPVAEINKIYGLDDVPGDINLDPTSFVFTRIYYTDDHKISDLKFHSAYYPMSEKVLSFVEQKLKEMGLQPFWGPTPRKKN